MNNVNCAYCKFSKYKSGAQELSAPDLICTHPAYPNHAEGMKNGERIMVCIEFEREVGADDE